MTWTYQAGLSVFYEEDCRKHYAHVVGHYILL